MVVIDASVAVKWVLVELTNILRQRVRQGSITLSEADRLLTDLLAFPIRAGTPDGLHRQALAIADT